jgi:signal transduction histidine kinase
MDQVFEFFRKLLDTADWPPRWHCGKWSEFHGWFYIISDLLIWSAYFAIPLVILKFITRKVNARFVRAYFLFAAFILACGATHLLDAVAFWFPAYRLNALVRFITGVVSWITVFHVVKLLPVALSLRSYEELEKEIKERELAEEKLLMSNTQLKEAQEIAKMGHWQWAVTSNELTWSEGMYKVYGMKNSGDQINLSDFLNTVHPDDKLYVEQNIKKALETKDFPQFSHRIVTPDGVIKTIHSKGEVLMDKDGNDIKMIGTAQDITDQYKAQQQLLNKSHELELSNSELQKFAYVASHDLQEPLRKIQTFSSLLERESDAMVGEKSKMYIDKITNSAMRMQRLIDSILQFSSIKIGSENFETTDLNKIIEQVLSDMEIRIQESGTVVQVDKLPVIEAIPTQMEQLFQNLISNAIKFKHPDKVPFIKIHAQFIKADELNKNAPGVNYNATNGSAYQWRKEPLIKISVQDNGIGFDNKYSDKIFEIFQRLHTTKTHEGTGIGLAICKKIVDTHHGNIKVSSKEGDGTTFIIILPVSQKHFQ